jgi:hypothetical protein
MLISLVFFVERIAFGLYIMSMAGIVFMAYRLSQARHELSVSQFRLEREHALVRQSNAITFGGLLIEFAIGIWAIANLMAPTIRDIRLGESQPTHTVQKFVTSTPAFDSQIVLDPGNPVDDGPSIFATPPPTATAVGTIIPEAPDIVGCPRDSAWLHIPGNGQLIFEATTVWGTAVVSDFSFYRFEIKPARPGAQFGPIGDYTIPVVNGPLGEIVPLNFEMGEYRFRLVVFDNTNMMRALCEVTIHISDPPPTPTPIVAETGPP